MNPYLATPLEMGPVVMSRLLQRISPADLDAETGEGRFTIREVIAHLADWEPILRARIERVRDEPGWTVEAFDEGRMAIENGYASQSVEEAMATWKEERARTAVIVRNLTNKDLLNPYNHPERGEEHLFDLVASIVGHDMYHLDQVSEFIA